jgi:hypothetical protein
MFYLIDNNNKIIFGWSAKCGCSHIKKLFYYLSKNDINHPIHNENEKNELPSDINEYIIIVFIRNPYKRIVSGFLDKYTNKGEFRILWKHDKLTFKSFVDELIKNNWNMIEYHHFVSQTSEKFNNNIINAKIFKIYDIEKIDYEYIEEIYGKKIPEFILNFRGGHEMKKYDKNMEENVFNLDIDLLNDKNIDLKYFYDEDIKNKIYNFYINDFTFFKNNNFNYDILKIKSTNKNG